MIEERIELIDTALGNTNADVVIIGGNLVNVFTREIYKANVLIKGKRIAAVLDSNQPVPPGAKIIHADGEFIAPGFIDPHMHLESSNLTLTEFAKAVMVRGVTTIAIDPHEICNVLGVRGIALLMEEAKQIPLNVFLRVPPRVPEYPSLETSGAELTTEDIKEMLCWKEAVCIAGDINPNIILTKEREHLEKIEFAISLGKTVSGASTALSEKEVNALIAAGLEDSHVPKNLEELIEDIRHGLAMLLTPRTTKFGVEEFKKLAELINDRKLDTRLLCFCTDDVWAHELDHQGHIDQRIRIAIAQGLDPLTAYQMATLNTAQLLRIERDYGSVTAGRFADIVILDDLEKVHVDKTLIHGEVISDSGKMTVDLLPYQYPEWAKRTIHVPSSLRPEDLQIKVDDSCHEINVRTIVNSWPKEVIINTLAVEHGKIQPDVEKDLLSIAIVERHKNTGNIGKGFVTGFRIKEGAVASSIQHNSHNIVVIGTNYEDMAIAVNSIIQMGGGYSAVKNGKVVGQVELPIAGLLSEEDYRVVSKKLVAFEQVVMEDLKCGIERPLYTLVFFCAPGVPHAGLTDKGLINVDTMDFMDAVVQ